MKETYEKEMYRVDKSITSPQRKRREGGAGRTPWLQKSDCHGGEQGNGDDRAGQGSVGGRLSVQASSSLEGCSFLRHQA